MELKCTTRLGCNPHRNTIYSRDGELVFIRCNDCGLIWRSPGSVHLKRTYGEDYFSSKDYVRNRKHKVRKSGWLIDMAYDLYPGIKSMLEIGCSVGNTLEAARKRNLDSTGIDISRFAVDYCLSCGLYAEHTTLQELAGRKMRFDLIVMQHVLEHFEDPFKTLWDCGNVLKKGGMVLIMLPNSKFRNASKGREKHRFYSKSGVGTEHYVYFDYASLRRVLESQDFRIVRQNYPLRIRKTFSPLFLLNRIVRRSFSLFNFDQELFVIAEKLS